MLPELLKNLMIAIVLGAAIGLERESHRSGTAKNGVVGGIRTFALIALSGGICGVFFLERYEWLGVGVMAAFLLLLIAGYVVDGISSKALGITSELSAVATFFMGVWIVLDVVPLQITVAVTVLLVFILSLKARTSKLMEGISRNEIQSFISYAIIALVALPALPDTYYKLQDLTILHSLINQLGLESDRFDSMDLINPRKIWMVVVLITGIDVFGYILGRLVGNKSGLALTSFMAGFVSSTSATQSLAQRSSKVTFSYALVGAAVLANLASFLQIFLLVGPLNPAWLVYITPAIVLMIAMAGALAVYYLRASATTAATPEQETKSTSIFSLGPALKFAALLVMIKIVTKICLIVFGQSGFIISSIIASFAGIDAIIVNLAEMAGHSITFPFALVTFLAINFTNLMSKSLYARMQGNRKFANVFLFSMLMVSAAGAVWLIFA